MPESAKPRSLGIYLRASTQEQQAPALALMGCVTLDVSTTFTESPLPVRNQRTGLRGSPPALPARLCLCLSCSDAGHPRHVPSVDTGLGMGQAPLEMASCWPQNLDLALLYVNTHSWST